MFARKIFTKLFEHLSKKQITIVTGMRRVGKTTALNFLLDKIKSNNKVYFDLEKIENRYIFTQNTYKDIEISLQIEGIDFSKKSYIFIDEIQLVPEITSVIKYLYDTYEIKFIVSGSSSFYIKNRFSESLAGRKRIFEMFPLDFSEFLDFKNIKIKQSAHFQNFNISYYTKFYNYYIEFLTYGGFPEVVLNDDKETKIEYLKDIINSYIELDIKLLSDFSVASDLYKLIKLLSTRVGSKTDYTKISNLTGIPRKKIKDYLTLLEYTYFIKPVSPFVSNIDREIAKQKKIYFMDTGLITVFQNINMPILLENSIAIQLSYRGNIKYYAKKSGQEIDFILNDKIAFEVKKTPSISAKKTLIQRSKSINIKENHLIGLDYPETKFKDFVWAGTI